MMLAGSWALHGGHVSRSTHKVQPARMQARKSPPPRNGEDPCSGHLSQALTHNPEAAQAPGQAPLAPPWAANQAQTGGFRHFLCFSSPADSIPQCPMHCRAKTATPAMSCLQPGPPSSSPLHMRFFQHQHAQAAGQAGRGEAGLRGRRSPQPWACPRLQPLSPWPGFAEQPHTLPGGQFSCSEGHKASGPSANNPNPNGCSFCAASPWMSWIVTIAGESRVVSQLEHKLFVAIGIIRKTGKKKKRRNFNYSPGLICSSAATALGSKSAQDLQVLSPPLSPAALWSSHRLPRR